MNRLEVQLTVAEYFAGIGLMRMGLEPNGWCVGFANDISRKKFDMYKAFFSDADRHYVIGDIFDVNPNEVPYAILATCSFPCIDLSLAGNLNGIIKGKHSSAFWGFIKILKAQKEIAPPILLIENVPGWLSSNKGTDFRVTVEALNKLGYACDVFVLDAARFTPQSRLRVFLIGTKLPMPKNIVSILNRPRSLLSDQLKRNIQENRDLMWFNLDLPDPPPILTGGLSEIVEQMSDTDSRWWHEEEVRRHFEMMNKSHQEKVRCLISEDQITYRTFYRRRREGQQRAEVRSDDIAGCLRTAIGGSGKQFILKAGKEKLQMRAMTAREYARLQGVPDEYPITVNEIQALTGFGDAVCVPVITWISENALIPLIERYINNVHQVFLMKSHG